MEGIGPPLVTPFDEAGNVDFDRLRDLVQWVEARGVDFIVPCGSTSEAELLTLDERRRVIETVVGAASVPVIAGTGHPGQKETLDATAGANHAGADAAMVVTPFYYPHDQQALATYYREVADAVSLPIYLYSVPTFTDVHLDPDTVGDLATHPNIVGYKDSSGSMTGLVRTLERVEDEAFDILVGSGGMLAQALETGAAGGILALANLYPGKTREILTAADPAAARDLNATLADVNDAITTAFGIPGLKWAMRHRGAPAGYPRSPHREPGETTQATLRQLLDDVE